MLAKFAVVLTAVLAVAAQQCNTGSLHCCQSVQSASSQSVAKLLALLGVPVQGVNAQVGLTCTPVTVIGIAGNNCDAQPACCTGQNYNGAVVLGCNPISANL
ncbi:fungal hydrophobin-domain-containing protein [Cyathus striatus]|nr:fungal hydrophobin-domain-containing protein [Cyathus striatus]